MTKTLSPIATAAVFAVASAVLVALSLLVVLSTPSSSGAQQNADLGNITLGVPLTISLANCPDIYKTDRESYRGRFTVFYDAGTSGDSYTFSREIMGTDLGDGNYAADLVLPIDGGTLGSYKVTSICQFLDADGQWIDLVVQPTVSFIPLPAPPGTVAPDVNADGTVVTAASGSLKPAFTG